MKKQETWNYYIDASTTRTGIVIENSKKDITVITSLDFSKHKVTKESKAEKQFDKFKYIKEKLDEFTAKYPPGDTICIEGIFVKPSFLNSSEVVIKLHGFLMLYFIDKEIQFYPPKSIKKVVLGNGNAAKQDVFDFVRSRYQIQCENYDQSDAFAVMLYHKIINHEEVTKKLKVGD